MSEVALGRAADAETAFQPRTMILIVLVGIACFAMMIVLAAFAPDLQSERNGGSHALSTGATGFSGIVRLEEETGRHPHIGRSDVILSEFEGLAVLTPEEGSADLGHPLELRRDKPTLIILPKWETVAAKGHPGWVRVARIKPAANPERTLAPQWEMHVARHRGSEGEALTHVADGFTIPAPRVLQTVSGPKLLAVVTDPSGNIVVARLGETRTYVLSDPDLLANNGMADLRRAEGAVQLLDQLNAESGVNAILFDVTLNGLGRSPSPLKLALVPPFLAATLSLGAALLLLAIRAATRFGRPVPPERALAFGKAALIDNSAALVSKARREGMLGGRYADMVRERAASLFAAPPRLTGAALDAYLDRIGRGKRFSELASAAGEARHRADMLAAAQALNDWQRENQG